MPVLSPGAPPPGSEKKGTLLRCDRKYRAKTEPDQAKDRDNRSNLNAPVVKQSGPSLCNQSGCPRACTGFPARMASDIVRKLCDRRIPQAWFLLQRKEPESRLNRREAGAAVRDPLPRDLEDLGVDCKRPLLIPHRSGETFEKRCGLTPVTIS